MATAHSINLRGFKRDDLPTVASSELIAETEARLGVRLPPAYIGLLSVRNGGYIDRHLIELAGEVPTQVRYYVDHGCVTVTSIFGVGGDDHSHGSLASNSYHLNEWELPSGLVLIDGDGHTWIALDYRLHKADPSVVFVVADGPHILNIAPNFADFLDRLKPVDEVYPDGRPDDVL